MIFLDQMRDVSLVFSLYCVRVMLCCICTTVYPASAVVPFVTYSVPDKGAQKRMRGRQERLNDGESVAAARETSLPCICLH